MTHEEKSDLIYELRAENERLKELAESWKGGHSIAALDRDLALDQIKRLEEALQRQDNAIIDKDAEIERLRALLTRAADALEAFGPSELMQDEKELISELRKAAE